MLKVPKVQSDSRTGPKRQHFLALVLLVFIVKVKEFAKVFRGACTWFAEKLHKMSRKRGGWGEVP